MDEMWYKSAISPPIKSFLNVVKNVSFRRQNPRKSINEGRSVDETGNRTQYETGQLLLNVLHV